jgi:hypothetical protein
VAYAAAVQTKRKNPHHGATADEDSDDDGERWISPGRIDRPRQKGGLERGSSLSWYLPRLARMSSSTFARVFLAARDDGFAADWRNGAKPIHASSPASRSPMSADAR